MSEIQTDPPAQADDTLPAPTTALAEGGNPVAPNVAVEAVESPVQGDTGQIVSFNGKFFIHTGKRLTHLDQGPVRAYAASEMSDVSQATYYALVCEPHLTPRSRAAVAFSSITNPNLVRLVATGPLYWPPKSAQHYVLIYENIIGKPLTPEGQFRGLGLRPDVVQQAIVKPLLYVLQDIHNSGIAHGNIRPSNMFPLTSGGVLDRTVLGECIATPSSYSQPVLFETLERAMCDPVARGQAAIEDDFYALGVSLAIILRHRDPMEGLNNDEIIRFKIEHGSYAALTGKDRFTGDILELLRGLLNDDKKQRWTMEDVMGWLDGQRLTPKQGVKKIKAARPVHFQDERYLRPALLAMDLNKNQAEAAQLIESGNLEQWVSRSLEDPAVMKRLESAIETSAELGRSAGYWDRLLCRVSIALDPAAPMRYKGVNVHPDGVGPALAEALIVKKDVQPYVDLINQQTALFWLSSQPETHVDIGSIVSRFDSCRAFLRQNSIAYGLERCLYFLNPEAHCLSEKLKGFYVRNADDLMQAFETISEDPQHPELFFDRHVTAFLSVKDRQDVDPYLMELGSEDMPRRIMGNIKILAAVQIRSRMGKFPGICRWIMDILDPVYNRFHDRELRATLKSKVAQISEHGDIAKIIALVDNPATIQRDLDGYNQARMDYYRLRVESAALESKMSDPEQFNQGIGREVAALFSCVLSGIVILFFVFMVVSRGAVF